MITNKRKYEPNLYGSQIVSTQYERLQLTDLSKSYAYKIQKHDAESEESYLGLGLMPKNKKQWFQFKELPETLSRDQDKMHFAVGFSLHRDVVHHSRSIYTFLDLLGDIGGLLDGLKGISSVLISFYFYLFGDPIHSYLLKALFLQNPQATEELNKK